MSRIIGQVVRDERKAQGLSQTELGDLAGTGLNFISQLERGKETVRLDKTLAVLNVLGLELSIVRGSGGLTVGAELAKK